MGFQLRHTPPLLPPSHPRSEEVVPSPDPGAGGEEVAHDPRLAIDNGAAQRKVVSRAHVLGLEALGEGAPGWGAWSCPLSPLHPMVLPPLP